MVYNWGMKISDVAKACGCSVRTIHNYHALGVLPEPRRTSANYREYSVSDLAHAFQIRTLSEAGIPLKKIGTAPLSELVTEAQANLDAQEQAIAEQRRRLDLLALGEVGAPRAVTQLLVDVIGNSDFAKHEIAMLDLMVIAGVTTPRTWELLSRNLNSASHIAATRKLAALWSCSEPTTEVLQEFREAVPQAYTQGIEETLRPGSLPFQLSDLDLSPAQRKLLEAALP